MKNIILITLVCLVYGCGYTSVYKNLENNNFKLTILDMQGDREMNNLIKNEINLYSNKNATTEFNIEVKTSYTNEALAKNSTGSITDYKLFAKSTFEIYFDEKSKKITFNETLNIKKISNSFDQNAYERSVKKNFASSLRQKLFLEILNLQ